MQSTGILLIHLGTPDVPTIPAIRRYLKTFLLDPDVINLPAFLRYLLVYGLVLPFRPKYSMHAYQQIWTNEGSPLLINSRRIQMALSQQLGQAFVVALGMRYGNPSIESAADVLMNACCKKIIVFPLFPQYTNATTGSVLKKTSSILKKFNGEIKIIFDFYRDSFYIDSYADFIQRALKQNPTDFLLFSYHGLPSRADDSQHYHQQCLLTSKTLAEKLNLSPNTYHTTFQSRLGRTKWIKPYTDQYLPILIQRGVKKLSVVCPSFVTDCLETLEEINIRLRNQWQLLGGTFFQFISCLNDDERWVAGLANALKKSAENKA